MLPSAMCLSALRWELSSLPRDARPSTTEPVATWAARAIWAAGDATPPGWPPAPLVIVYACLPDWSRGCWAYLPGPPARWTPLEADDDLGLVDAMWRDDEPPSDLLEAITWRRRTP